MCVCTSARRWVGASSHRSASQVVMLAWKHRIVAYLFEPSCSKILALVRGTHEPRSWAKANAEGQICETVLC